VSDEDAYQLSYSLTSLLIKGAFAFVILGGVAWLIFLLVRSSKIRRQLRASQHSHYRHHQQPPYHQYPTQQPYPPQQPSPPQGS
jgi:hypothetical protein